MSFAERKNPHDASDRFHLGTSGDLLDPIIAALHQNVGKQLRDQLTRRVLAEKRDPIDAREAGEHVRAALFVVQWSLRSFQPTHGSVRIERDDEHVAERARREEILHVSRMQDIENAVGEYDAFTARACERTDERGAILDLRFRTDRRAHGSGTSGAAGAAARIAARISFAPAAIRRVASSSPIRSAPDAGPSMDARKAVLPSSENTAASR